MKEIKKFEEILPTLSVEGYHKVELVNGSMTLKHIRGEISDEEFLRELISFKEKVDSISISLGKDSNALQRLLIELYGEDRKDEAEEQAEHEIAHAKKYEERNLNWSFGVFKFKEGKGISIQPFVFGDIDNEMIKWSPVERIKFRLNSISSPDTLSEGDERSIKFWKSVLKEFEKTNSF